MVIAAALASYASTASIEAFLAGRRIFPLSATVDLGFDIVASSASVVLASRPSWFRPGQELTVMMGHNGTTQSVFVGFVDTVDDSYDPSGQTVTLQATGPLRRAQNKLLTALTYSSDTDQDIVTDLLTEAGITSMTIAGAGMTLGTVRAVTMQAGDDPWDVINRIDQVTGCKTFDGPDGVVRRRVISGNPGQSSVRTLTEGTNIYSISRPRTIRGIANAVIVRGLQQPSVTPLGTRSSDNPYVLDPPGAIVLDFQSDLIETGAIADTVAARLLTEHNKVLEQVAVKVKGDPRRLPGDTIRVVASTVGLDSGANFWLRHVTHTFDATGYVTTLALEGGTGSEGSTELEPPIAAFVYRVSRETYEVSGTPTDMYTVTCDAAASSDPDGTIAAYSWSNNKTADAGTASTYSVAFTSAQIATATITLQVTDNDGYTNSTTVAILSGTDRTMVRDLYVAASSRAEATADGGKTWQTWTPGAGTVVSTPPIAGETHSYFGLSDGKLYRTGDYLVTAPTLVHTFASQVNCIWIHEQNADRVTVGCQDGTVHHTIDASLLGSSTWSQLKDYADPVYDIVESFVAGQYRVATGDSIRITYDEFASDAALITWSGGTARRVISSIVGLPGIGAATVSSGTVKDEAGTTYTYSGGTAPTDVRAGTHHIRQPLIWVADRAGKVWKTAVSGTSLALLATIGAGDPANQMIRDGDNQDVLYVAADDAAWKSFDGGAAWHKLRDYVGGSLVGLQMGYGGLRALAIAATTIVSNTTDAVVLDLWNGSSNNAQPAGWHELGFDDSAWATPVSAYIHPSYTPVSGTTVIGPATFSQSLTQQALFRHVFTLPTGTITTATLNIATDDLTTGVWINNLWYGSNGTAGGLLTVSVDPSSLMPGADNIIAVHATNVYGNGPPIGGFATSYKLEVA